MGHQRRRIGGENLDHACSLWLGPPPPQTLRAQRRTHAGAADGDTRPAHATGCATPRELVERISDYLTRHLGIARFDQVGMARDCWGLSSRFEHGRGRLCFHKSGLGPRASPPVQDEKRPHMYKTILVTVDGTPTDRAIIEHVKQLAKLTQGKVVLLHVADGGAARTYGPDAVSREISDDTAHLH